MSRCRTCRTETTFLREMPAGLRHHLLAATGLARCRCALCGAPALRWRWRREGAFTLRSFPEPPLRPLPRGGRPAMEGELPEVLRRLRGAEKRAGLFGPS